MLIMKSRVKGSVCMTILFLMLVIFLALPRVTSSRRNGKIHSRVHHRTAITKQPAAAAVKPATKRSSATDRDATITTRPSTTNWLKRKPTGGAAAMWVRRPARRGHAPDPLQVAGSSLPDCSHACGSCSPCRLVMVSFVCATLEEAETCPMAYKCMCRNKSYPVP